MAFFSRTASPPSAWMVPARSRLGWTGLLLMALQLGQPALAQTETRTWSGTGQILSGHGQGATVQLIVETGGGRIWTQSGPALNAPFSGGHTSVNSGDGTWQIQAQGEQLFITFYRGEQIIRWQLRPASVAPSPSIPTDVSTGATEESTALPVQELIIPVLSLPTNP
ncbi:MAG: hypothetical protein Q6L68_06745 [Thermostichus sp. DG02_5_bins_236]